MSRPDPLPPEWGRTPQFTGRQQAAKPAVAAPVELVVRRHRGALLDVLFCGISAGPLTLLGASLEHDEPPFTQVPDVVLELRLRSITHQQVKSEWRRARHLQLLDSCNEPV